jgi:hypothetical protein
MWKTLNKFIACILLAALITPALPTTAAAQWSQKQLDEQAAFDREAARDQKRLLLISMAVILALFAFDLFRDEIFTDNAQKQRTGDLGRNQGREYAPPAGFGGIYKINGSAVGVVQTQRPGGLPGREDAQPDFSRGYIPPE